MNFFKTSLAVAALLTVAFPTRLFAVNPMPEMSNRSPSICAFLVGANGLEPVASDDDADDKLLVLSWPEGSVEVIRNRLQWDVGVSPKQIVAMSTNSPDQLRPTKKNFEQRFDEFVNSIMPGDVAFVYLSGRGLLLDADSASYFIPDDFDAATATASLAERDRAILVEDVLDKLANQIAKLSQSGEPESFGCVILDVRSFRPYSEDETLSATKILTPRRGVAFVKSADYGESPQVFEQQSVRTSVFARSLESAFDLRRSEVDSDRDGAVTFEEFFEFVRNETAQITRGDQNPSCVGDYDRAYPILNYAEGVRDKLVALDDPAAACLKAAESIAQQDFKTARKFLKDAETYDRHRELVRLLQREIEREEETLSTPTIDVEPLDRFVNDLGMTFLRASDEPFMMGNAYSPDELRAKYDVKESDAFENAPLRKVSFSSPYYLSKYETTVGEFRAFVEATGYATTAEKTGVARGFSAKTGKFEETRGLTWREPGYEQTSRHPVGCLSWEDARAFVDWLNATAVFDKALGAVPQYRLPTEAEWENAARAGSSAEFFWGDALALGEGRLNGGDATGAPNGAKWRRAFPFNDGVGAAAPVGSFEPNAFGFCDMLGNVGEWCEDWFGAWETTPCVDPTGASTGELKVNRGGAWFNGPSQCRCSFRGAERPDVADVGLGFRVAMTPSAR